MSNETTLDDVLALAGKWREDALLLGESNGYGLQLDRAAEELEALLPAIKAALEDARDSTDRRALVWLAGRDSGLSSKAILHHMIGMESEGDHPWDPADLGRCLRLLEVFPEWKPRIGEMARYSRRWTALAARWDELADMMRDEVGIDWSKGKSAPRTYAAMKAVIDAKDPTP